MVLQKRKRNGDFETWKPAGSSPTSSPPKAPNPTPVASTSQLFLASVPNVDEEPDEAPPAKKTRGGKSGGQACEAREARCSLQEKAPAEYLDRVGRVMTQRFFMVDRKRVEGELKEEFQVLGSTGNIYTVTISQRPSCDCPDAQKGNHCKHILFIYLKVLQVPQASGAWYQKALLTSELEQIFAAAPLAPNALAHPRIREAYARATGKATTSAAPSTPDPVPKKRVPTEDDDCPICYDGMHGAADGALTFCEECGNAVHAGCFAQWKQTAAKSHAKLTCIYCRACVWPTAAPNVASGSGASRISTGAGGISQYRGRGGGEPATRHLVLLPRPAQGRTVLWL
ncbi:hypothetical protein C8J57DRAFT_1449129 [Mycena rebaudengoi]|nr:hypothetical protein C8J57DRAFT_1449129 [Mycena rebaudengoi]